MDAYDNVLASLGLEPSSDTGPCGSYRGYARHRYYGETPCDACREANAEYKAARLRATKDPRALPPIEHGTPNGARQHWYRREQPCDECLHAYNAQNRPRWRDYDRNRGNGDQHDCTGYADRIG